MTVLQKIEDATFVHAGLKNLLSALVTEEESFKKRSKMETFHGIIVGIIDVYREDATTITDIFSQVKPVKSNVIRMKEVNLDKPKKTETGGCDDCGRAKGKEFKLTDAHNEHEVKEYFIGGVGVEAGCMKMVNYLKSNGKRPSNSKLKDADYLARKVFEMVKDTSHILSVE